MPRHTVAICRSCPRDTLVAATGGANPDGIALELRATLLAHDYLASRIEILMVHCLGACRRPCAAALSAPGKWRLRFERLSRQVIADFIATAVAYLGTEDGRLDNGDMPPPLRERLSAQSPPAMPRRISANDTTLGKETAP